MFDRLPRGVAAFANGLMYGFASVIFVWLILSLAGCGTTRAGTPSPSWGRWDNVGGPYDECPRVTVVNNGFADVVVRHRELRIRWNVTGLMSRSFQTCDLVGRPAAFVVDPIGERFTFDVVGYTTLDFGSDIRVIIERNRRASHILGNTPQGFGVGPTDGLEIVNLRMLRMTPETYRGVYLDMATCAGVRPEHMIPFDRLQFGVASRIRDVETDALYYGVYIHDRRAFEGRPTVIFEEGYSGHLTVVSHELLHVLGFAEDSPEMFGCKIGFIGSDLEERYANGRP